MTINELEVRLKQINPDFEIRVNSNSSQDGKPPEMAGLYYKGFCCYIGLPAQQIFETRNTSFTDSYGNVHRGADEVIACAENFLDRMEKEPEFRSLIMSNDDMEGVAKPKITLRK
jgi:hypothetical protein